jgi:uncharacterized protein with ATP-grasp and redox domains
MDGGQVRNIRRQAEAIIEEASFDQAPARISTLLHRLIRSTSGVDPYRRVKKEYNRIALDMLPSARSMAEASRSSSLADGLLEGGVRAAIAGNVIDFGIYDTVDLGRALDKSFRFPLAGSSFQDFSLAVSRAARILYLCDNAGEIVFDRILLDVLRAMGKRVVAAVKGVPVINDATIADAEEAGLRESADEVIDNGNDGIGTLLELCSNHFLEVYRSADIIISKGQANFETLAPARDDRIHHLFMVKCPVVATELGRHEGDIVLIDNGQLHAAVSG